jgi:acyl-coenzyme A synthetase/AMP-(fatty) acid ligase
MAMYEAWISHWAQRNPDSIAVVAPGGAVRYAEFDGLINKTAARLAALGLPAGGRVAVHVPDEYVHWLLLLALDRLGLGSASVGMVRPDNPLLAAIKPSLVLSVNKGQPGTLEVSAAWLEEVRQMPPTGRPARRGELDKETVRFFSSSGTTGTPKTMALSRAQVAARVETQRMSGGIGAASRGCVLFGPGTSGGYTWPLAFWLAGGSVVLNMIYSASIAEALARTQPTHLYIAIGTLVDLVRGPKAIASPLPSMTVYTVGSALPRALADEARRKLSPNIGVAYGTTEVAGVAAASPAVMQQHESTVGHVLPGEAVEAVDADGKVVPPGAIGLLRIRTRGMISGYLDEDPRQAAASAVRDGWFYPDDLGSVSADGLVTLHGRASELLNIGGNKYAPQALEELALTCAGIRDAAAFSVPDKLGVETPWIAVVRGEDHKPGELVGKLKARWPQLGELQVVTTPAIPRNQMGKIDRLKLREQGMGMVARAAG